MMKSSSLQASQSEFLNRSFDFQKSWPAKPQFSKESEKIVALQILVVLDFPRTQCLLFVKMKGFVNELIFFNVSLFSFIFLDLLGEKTETFRLLF